MAVRPAAVGLALVALLVAGCKEPRSRGSSDTRSTDAAESAQGQPCSATYQEADCICMPHNTHPICLERRNAQRANQADATLAPHCSPAYQEADCRCEARSAHPVCVLRSEALFSEWQRRLDETDDMIAASKHCGIQDESSPHRRTRDRSGHCVDITIQSCAELKKCIKDGEIVATVAQIISGWAGGMAGSGPIGVAAGGATGGVWIAGDGAREHCKATIQKFYPTLCPAE